MIRFDIDHDDLRLGLVLGQDVIGGMSPEELVQQIRDYEGSLRMSDALFCDRTSSTIRTVLRKGGYKPSGRGKPASEYLYKLAKASGLPLINVLVDINNFVSVKTGYPISIFDAARLGTDLSVRFGREGEKYAFNSAGQEIDLKGLPVICRKDEPVGNAIKDGMLCKVSAETGRSLAVIYGSREGATFPLEEACALYADLLTRYAHASRVETILLPS